jgi:prepilin-type N-terminal cleavage/methylation domain-containing protein
MMVHIIFKRGFTLIELLVVIAIIGLLSSVVLASLNTARGKGADASVKSNFNNIRTQSIIILDQLGGNYGTNSGLTDGTCPTAAGNTIFATSTIFTMLQAAKNSAGTSGVACRFSATSNLITSWAISAQLKSNSAAYWCVDSTGAVKQNTAAVSGSSC